VQSIQTLGWINRLNGSRVHADSYMGLFRRRATESAADVMAEKVTIVLFIAKTGGEKNKRRPHTTKLTFK
jgi:hypothetical protein